ncbi:MAG: phosphoribosylglycinamide formyltransferase [Treponema sp.]|nr:phosphoribosylglycinamide formyltransferase [Treponema sp.]
MNILVLVSGSGTNLQALLDAETEGRFRINSKDGNSADGSPKDGGHIAAVVSDRAGVFALERAGNAGIPALIAKPDKRLPKKERREELSNRLLGIAREYQAELIILAGFLSILKGTILREYEGRIINLHPALLPKYGGAGMYGSRVHEAVLAAGEKESGCTVHLVDEGTDTGPILLQRKVPVLPGDTAESLAERIHKEEHIAIVAAAVLMLDKKSK